MSPEHPQIRVSVVAPVYNAAPYLGAFVDSFLSQSLPAETIELIAVNDGSTDISGEILDRFASDHANITVIHQENSGWPGKPRNVGLASARGDYVFFADPDDEFGGPEALERLADFADEHGSDVVVPKMVPKGNRVYAQWRYKTTQVDADLVTAFTTLTPQKLFRRSFLESEDIRFPEQKVRLEDGQFLSQAYLKASRVSILSGYEFYFIIDHPDQDHLSRKVPDPQNYIGSVSVMSENVEKLCTDSDVGDRIIDEIYFRKVLANFTNSSLVKHPEDRRQAWLENQRRFVDRFINESRYSKLGPVGQARTDLVRAGDLDAILDYARAGLTDFEFVEARSERGIIELHGAIRNSVGEDQELNLVLQDRENPSVVTEHPISRSEGQPVVRLPKTTLTAANGTRRYDLFFSAGEDQQNRRVKGPRKPFSQTFTDHRQIEIYTTKMGNLSVAVSHGLSASERISRGLKRRLKTIVGRRR